ncbi:S8 family serine peptidase [Nibribacter ruber]|uniref:S8 family serine peptidase n=1 Tax=Nibribacter ruber TaxID=2698458 RepID=A0A6P1NVF0_9BACT|nr:S8 family peptidase [Nibribacter ruber]QHL85958.1 S8 family serine peptidase [Nibribacter ruber]
MKKSSTFSAGVALALAATLGASFPSWGQNGPTTNISSFDKQLVNWYNMSPEVEQVQGTSVNRVYQELLPTRTPKRKVVVAVIDSGVDILHEDLQGRIWTNAKEIAGNGLDDDQNGYVDDVHGWGFLGNAAGQDITFETYEFVRIYRKLSPLYSHVTSVQKVPAAQQEEYKLYLSAKKAFDEELAKQQKNKQSLQEFGQVISHVEGILAQHLGKKEVTLADVKGITNASEDVLRARAWLLSRYELGYTPYSFQQALEMSDVFLNQHLNLTFDPRTLLADNPEDLQDRRYGNPNVAGPRPDHGTPVAGLIAAVRNNQKGIDGIAQEVEIMALRAVPQGDERDKDIALAIRYAVDNGAHIINMSFGKSFSPQKSMVDEAVAYAASKNVLLVHSAGNDAANNDQVPSYPTSKKSDGTLAQNWLEVGANARLLDENLCGEFSNYGKLSVDLFAPGVDIISLAPENRYNKMEGTSFSSPVVSGVAALVWSYYPELTALELKEVLLASTAQYPKQKVYLPNLASANKRKIAFASLSKSGGIVNAYQAMLLAEKKVAEKGVKN